MIRNTEIAMISFYQMFLSPALKVFLGTNAMCRFDETCSAYSKRMIKEKGVLAGTFLGFTRILKCQPLTS